MLHTYFKSDIRKLISDVNALTPGWKLEWEDVTLRSRRVSLCQGLVISICDNEVTILWSWQEPLSFEQLRKVDQQELDRDTGFGD